jgi:hypothetical protein
MAGKKAVSGNKRSAQKRTAARKKRPAMSKRPKQPAALRLKPKRSRPVRVKRPSAGRPPRDTTSFDVEEPIVARGLGPEAGGQSGDTEGLSREELAASESVEELIEEGQAFEAGVISGVENAPEPDRGEVRTRQVPEDDVPQEYLDED